MTRIIYIPFDQLNLERGGMKIAERESDVVVLVESQRMLTGRKWHKQRLQFPCPSRRFMVEQSGFAALRLPRPARG